MQADAEDEQCAYTTESQTKQARKRKEGVSSSSLLARGGGLGGPRPPPPPMGRISVWHPIIIKGTLMKRGDFVGLPPTPMEIYQRAICLLTGSDPGGSLREKGGSGDSFPRSPSPQTPGLLMDSFIYKYRVHEAEDRPVLH